MTEEEGKTLKKKFSNLEINHTYKKVLKGFEQPILGYKDKNKSFLSHIWINRGDYLNFLTYPAGKDIICSAKPDKGYDCQA